MSSSAKFQFVFVVAIFKSVFFLNRGRYTTKYLYSQIWAIFFARYLADYYYCINSKIRLLVFNAVIISKLKFSIYTIGAVIRSFVIF